MVLLHGFMETWRSWELVLPALERRHEVLAPTLAGHAGGPALGRLTPLDEVLAAVEAALDDADIERTHLVGNSLGGYVALRLAERGRAESVVAFAPAGGWADGDRSYRELLASQHALAEEARAAAPHAGTLLATVEGRRRATRLLTTRFEHIPTELIDHQLAGVASCRGVEPLIDYALRFGWPLAPDRIDCPVRIVWGTEDRLLPWPSAATRYRTDLLPHADWVVLDGVGHCPQLDVPAEAAALVVEFCD